MSQPPEAQHATVTPFRLDQHRHRHCHCYQTFTGDAGAAFADEVRAARSSGLPIAMIHENDVEQDSYY